MVVKAPIESSLDNLDKTIGILFSTSGFFCIFLKKKNNQTSVIKYVTVKLTIAFFYLPSIDQNGKYI